MKTKEKLARNIIQERLGRGLLGAGSDIWGLSDSDEIISDYPLQRYFTGIIFPPKDKVNSQYDLDMAEVEIETAEADFESIDSGNFNDEEENHEESKEQNGKQAETEQLEHDIRMSQNNFFPTNIGLTFSVESAINEIEVEFRFGVYYEPKFKEIKIAIRKKGYNSFLNNPSFPFKDIINYDGGFLSLKRPLEGNKGGRGERRSGEYLIFDEFKKSKELKEDSLLTAHFHLFEKLIGRTWKRKEIKRTFVLPLANSNKSVFEESINKNHKLSVGYYLKKYVLDTKTYVKILLVNDSTPQSPNRYSNKNEILNKKCIFQTEIMISSDSFRPYKSYHEINPFDEEAEILNFLYRKVKNYGIGHNTSVVWDNQNNPPKWIKTTFMPEYDVTEIKNNLTEEDFDNPDDYQILNNSLDIYNLSHFGLKKEETVRNLNAFVNLYGTWIKEQKKLNRANNTTEQEIGNRLIHQLEYNFHRLKNNIGYLEDDKVFKCFQLANTAMLIQLIISNDENFSQKEKYLDQISPDIPYDKLEFFKNYKNDLPKYRPFQLAFFILNLDGIIEIDSRSRKKIVDLLWFPTGGGKTEAYLAIAAFTIIWRRLGHERGYEGTSVIMRYTLRLLTAQQFERASRLIAALEFLRNSFKKELKDEPITIGLWVGMASTPNKLEEAKTRLNSIERECQKGEQGRPEGRNVFQISACPWCGCKLINKNPFNDEWVYGFEIARKNFKIRCLNENCTFSDNLPVQVIDEILYRNPPTLLFATVDKFAMLAWQEDGHVFFNSLDEEKLPPDLIIQDELHLLNGPLGSITGIYESIVELLCTKGDKFPRIVASTATTRNTNYQIKQLYGNRKVNIFPPSGLTHNDSFFAREMKKESNRRYIGFMPTGKTAIDTQLQILSHLLVARIEIYKDAELVEILDKYWTIVSYYNSLKDVGKISNKVGDEILSFTRALQQRLLGQNRELTFNYNGIPYRHKELTGRVESYRIKQVLKQIEEATFSLNKIEKTQIGNTIINDVIDLILATNMISVGIDIGRLNIMLVNNQPKNIAEYIQATSRVCRRTKGLVVSLLDANRARDKSYFEHFIPFHQAFYKNVEPISLTPFTENTIDKMISSLMITYVRHKVGKNKNNDAQYFESEDLKQLKHFLKARFKENGEEYKFFERTIDRLAEQWGNNIKPVEIGGFDYKSYNQLMKRPAQKDVAEDDKWIVMQSMREIDTSTFIQIKEDYTINN